MLVTSLHGTLKQHQFSSVAQSCATLCDPMDCSVPGFPDHHQLPELTQTHVHLVNDSIQSSSVAISFSSVPFFCLQTFLALGSFSMSQFVTSGGQSIGVSASTSVLPMNIQDWFPFRLTGMITLLSKGLVNFLQHHSSKASVLLHLVFFTVQLSHPYVTTGKTIALTRWTIVGKVMSLVFNMLSRFVIAVLPRNKCLLISWLQSPSAVNLGPQKIMSVSIVSPVICPEVMGPDAIILVFWMFSFTPTFSLSVLSFSSEDL